MCFRIGAATNVARREFPQWNRMVNFSLLIGLAVAMLAGCSGGGTTIHATPTPGASATPPAPAPVTVKSAIFWAARTKAYSASGSGQVLSPSSAVSADIRLVGANTGGGDLTITANRDPNQLGQHIETYTLAPGQATPGKTYPLHVDFYATPGGKAGGGSLVATADAVQSGGIVNGTVVPGGALVNTDGTLAMTVTTSGRIQSVVINGVAVTGQSVGSNLVVGQSGTVSYSAFDGPNGTGNLVAVTPGSGSVNSSSIASTAILAATGEQITANAPILATTFTVVVDQVESTPFTLSISSLTKIAVTPNPVTASYGLPIQFTATVTGDSTNAGVVFTLKEGTTAGTLGPVTTTPTTSQVTYTPPSLPATRPATPPVFTLVVTSKYDPNVFVAVPITVKSLVGVTFVSPNPVPVLEIKSTQQFTATVSNVPSGLDAGVTWSVQESNGGTITSSGLYTASAVAGTYHIVATSNFDTTQSVVIPVTVISLYNVVVTPTQVTVATGGTQQFNAAVNIGTAAAPQSQSAVVWSLAPGSVGTVSVAGLYTAPATAGTFTVIATSVFDPTKSGSATGTVKPVALVTLTPTSSTLSINATKQFAATVTGLPIGLDTGVTWSVTESGGGTVSQSGLYTAPSSVTNPQGTTFHVVATSKYDATKSATAAVTVGSGTLTIGVN